MNRLTENVWIFYLYILKCCNSLIFHWILVPACTCCAAPPDAGIDLWHMVCSFRSRYGSPEPLGCNWNGGHVSCTVPIASVLISRRVSYVPQCIPSPQPPHPQPALGFSWAKHCCSSLGLMFLPLAKTTTILMLLRRLADRDLTFLNYEVKNTRTVMEWAYFLSQKSAWRRHKVWLSSRLSNLGWPFS